MTVEQRELKISANNATLQQAEGRLSKNSFKVAALKFGRNTALAAGIISTVAALYWGYQAFFKSKS